MKKIIVSLALLVSTFYLAQDKKDLNVQIQEVNKSAVTAYESKDYVTSATKFDELYNLLKSNGSDDKIYLYYSGLSYALANKDAEAIKIYSDLVDSNFTGIQTKYTAKDKSGKVEEFDKNTWDLLKKTNKDYTDFKTEQTAGVETDLYETLSTLLLRAEKGEEALKVIEKGLAKFPNSVRLKENQSTALFSTGKTDEFEKSLRDLLEKNPNDATSWYNLGVMQSKAGKTKDAIESFGKALAIQPTMDNAHMNLVYTIMGNDESAVKEINDLRKANKMDEATEKIEARKERFTQAIPYAEKWHAINPKSIEAVQTLKDLYQITKNSAKAKEMVDKEAVLLNK